MSPSSLTILACIATAWVVLNIWSRLRSFHELNNLSNRNTRGQHLQDAESLSYSTSSWLGLQLKHGWFWLVVERTSILSLEQVVIPSIRNRRQAEKGRAFTNGLFDAFYTFGALVTLLGYVALPFYLFFNLYFSCFVRNENGSIEGDPTSVYTTAMTGETSGILIPGVTVPLRDTGALLLASIVAIAWHEAGHAFAAILAHVEVLSYALILLFIFPGAYVSISSSGLEALPTPSAKLRIITAGVWHNFVLCAFIAIGMSGKGGGYLGRNSPMYGWVGFSDLNEAGVIVQSIMEHSPLEGLMLPGLLVTHLDDVELHDSVQYKHWDRYLLSIERADTFGNTSNALPDYDNLGFCVDAEMYETRDSTCCALKEATAGRSEQNSTESNSNKQVCFARAQHEDLVQQDGHCLDPSELLTANRCTTTCSNTDELCTRPSASSHLLRITLQDPHNAQQVDVVFYQGPKATLWNDVKVGKWKAPGSWRWMQSMPVAIETFWSYTASISLSLALFNLLPLPRLDGGEILEVLLASSSTASFSPILPLAGGGRGVKTCSSGEVTQQHNKMDHALTWTINTASALLGGRAPGSSRLGPIRRRNDLVRRVVQVTIGGLAGLQVMTTLYSQFSK